jgi:YfiH family protein
MMPLLFPDWDAPPGVRAAFTLRSGGASVPPWDSLNLGVHVGDDPLAVAANRRRVAQALSLPAEPCWLAQVHGTGVHEVERVGPAAEAATADARAADAPVADPPVADPPVADAAVTRSRGAVLAIQVADCLPVLLASEDGAVLGAAHAGWRGLVAGVVERTVECMGHPPARLVAWLGPCIGPQQFEVGEDVREAFLAAGDAPGAFRQSPAGRWLCDLPAIARGRLQRLGVERVAGGEWCTVADPVRFFSHRRDRLTGRMAALLWHDVL